jgi:CDP-paratose 2-epimerase
MRVLVTGSNGLIGSEAVRYYDGEGNEVIGLDNNMRAVFFGPAGDTSWNLRDLKQSTRRFVHYGIDIRNRELLNELFQELRFDLILHCAAQPSHDKARDIPFLDFEVNAGGTLNLLEMARRFSPECTFILMSTNKVYGDAPNEIPLIEMDRRYDYARSEDWLGINEACRIDRSLHSLFGASKLAADIVAQEYGLYFGMNVGVFRGGCLTGRSHSGVELHGFLSYLVKVALSGGQYTIFGYKGKQVRDNIHSYDVIQAFEAYRRAPRPGEVYNLGGCRENSISIIEAIDLVERISGHAVNWTYDETNRSGDHICYISDMSKFKRDYPGWRITRSLSDMVIDIVESELRKKAGTERSLTIG